MAIPDQLSHPIEPGAEASRLLDAGDAIARVMGDRALYARMIARFRADYAGRMAPIRAAIDCGELDLAHRLAHTLKGASGMIGAHALHQQAGLLELALRQAPGCLADLLAGVEHALAQVLQMIERLLASEPMGTPAQPVQPGKDPIEDPIADLIALLATLLANGDGAAVELLEQAAASLKAALGETGFREVEQAANEFDFDGALDALRKRGGLEAGGAR